MSSVGVLKTMFGHDDSRDESRLSRSGSNGSNGSGSGRNRSSDGVKAKTTNKSANIHRGTDPAKDERAILTPKNELGRASDVDNRKERSKDKGNGKGKERERRDSRERGRSRSKKGAGRKLNLWEEI